MVEPDQVVVTPWRRDAALEIVPRQRPWSATDDRLRREPGLPSVEFVCRAVTRTG